jgi:intracellular sulfur oxidation DsrE/DsrF family protein
MAGGCLSAYHNSREIAVMTDRRSFVTRFTSALGAFGAVMAAPTAVSAQEQGKWTPARHAADDWLDAIPGKHRFFYDSTTAPGAGSAITFATNYYVANKSGYNLGDSDLAVVICLRHWSTPFAWTDAMWAKYGKPISERIQFVDPKTNEAPVINVYQSTAFGMQLPNRGTTLDVMIKRGVHFAVCDMATRAYAGVIANALKLKADDVYADLRANSIANTHYVAAGIVTVSRAQERGYALAQMG